MNSQTTAITRPRVQPVIVADRIRLFTAAVLVCCTVLQRFGVPFAGGKQLNIAGPAGLAVALAGLMLGALVLHRGRLMIFIGLLLLVAIGEAHALSGLPAFGAPVSVPSIGQFLVITGFAIFTFAEPMDEAVFFRLINRALLIVAIAGIAQFAAQFVGLRVFEFTGLLPKSILAETGWNLVIPIGIGDINKTNGFVLVEPSVMSQFMALGIIIEVLFFRRPLYLGVIGLGLLLSFSGTGFIVLAAFLIAVALRLGLRGLALAVLLLLCAALLAGAVAVLAPDIAETLQSRMGEIQQPGTSGFERFITPFWLLNDVLTNAPAAFLLGIGGGTAEHLSLSYAYDVNTPIKILIEYGAPVLVLYVALFVTAQRTTRQSVIVFPALVLLMLTGGYQQFGPVVFLITLLICTARLTPTAA